MPGVLSLPNDQRDSFKRGLLISLGAHVAVFLIFTVKMVFFAGEPINYQAAVRVDLVALPDKMDPNQKAPPITPPSEKPEAKAPPKPEKTKPEKAPKAEKAEKKVEKTVKAEKTPVDDGPSIREKQKEALNKLKAMEALEKLKSEAQKETKTASASTKKQDGEVKYKGNILSPGTELTGLNRLQHEEYIAQLDRHIKQNWTLPEWLAKKNYKAQIRVHIDDKGHIISKALVKSSGNPAYDDIVKATIDRSAPFPPPPEKFTAVVSVNGILIGFPE